VSSAEKVLKQQLPRYFRPISEFGEILKAQGYGLDQFDKASTKVYANNYIATCDEETIAYYERLLGIVYRFGDTMEYRRTRVLQKYNTIVPFSVGFLRDKLTELYGEDGYEMSVDSAACKLKIKVTSDRYGAIDLLYDLLWDVVPAHIQILANQQTTNRVPCRLYVAGAVSRVFVQTIYRHTVYDIEEAANTGGAVTGTKIQTISNE
jgi:hypothetical protein